MKQRFWLSLVCVTFIFFISSCTKSASTTSKVTVPPVNNPGNAYVQYVIPAGQHFATGTEFILQQVNISKMHFFVVFDSSAIYTSDTAHNQGDVNKLGGFADNAVYDHHKFSARFGWNWRKGALWLYGYIYNNGIMSFKALGAIPIGKPADCTIIADGDKYHFLLNGAETIMPRASTTATAIGYKLYPYFGGTETAPHQVDIDVKEVE